MTQPERRELLGTKSEPAENAENIEALKQELAETKKKAEDYLAGWQRAQADFINYKRRAEQEKEELVKFANAKLMLALLPIIDDLERAFESVPPESGLNWVEGFKMIERKLKAGFETQGLTPIVAVGQPFDPNFHEAVREEKGKDGIVIQEMERGYLLNGKLLRPAKVTIGNGEEKED